MTPAADDAEATPAGAGERPRGEFSTDLPTEEYGPLLVERHRKDDGRALILYSRRRRP
jgi:hypothetical protein